MKCSALNVDFNRVRLDPLGSRSPPYERIKFGYPLKTSDFCYCRLIQHENGCRQTQTCCQPQQALPTSFPVVPTSMTLNDLEPPKQGFLVIYFLAILGCNAHFKSEQRRNRSRQTRTKTCMKCSALNVNFNGVRFDPQVQARSPLYAHITFGYPLENVRFLLLSTVSMRMAADRHFTCCIS